MSAGFLKHVCGPHQFKCAYSNVRYDDDNPFSNDYFTPCPGDDQFYQVCGTSLQNIQQGSATPRQYDGTLCGDYVCKSDYFPAPLSSKWVSQMEMHCNHVHDCVNTQLDEVGCFEESQPVALPSGITVQSVHQICDDKCDSPECEDEANCNGYTYGIYCCYRNIPMSCRRIYVPPLHICNGEDETGCSGEDETGCLVQVPLVNMLPELRPIFNYTRSFRSRVAGLLPEKLLHQTNCSDPERVAPAQ